MAIVEIDDRRPGFRAALRAVNAWFRRDHILRRFSLVVAGLCAVFVSGYIVFHTILLLPVLLLGVLCFWFGTSGFKRPSP